MPHLRVMVSMRREKPSIDWLKSNIIMLTTELLWSEANGCLERRILETLTGHRTTRRNLIHKPSSCGNISLGSCSNLEPQCPLWIIRFDPTSGRVVFNRVLGDQRWISFCSRFDAECMGQTIYLEGDTAIDTPGMDAWTPVTIYSGPPYNNQHIFAS